jgi:hypothetical protein
VGWKSIGFVVYLLLFLRGGRFMKRYFSTVGFTDYPLYRFALAPKHPSADYSQNAILELVILVTF